MTNLDHQIAENNKKRNWTLRNRTKETENSIRAVSDVLDDVEKAEGEYELNVLKNRLKEVAHYAMFNVYVPSYGGDTKFNLEMQRSLEDLMDNIIDTAYRIGVRK